jgi:hypothetical protein
LAIFVHICEKTNYYFKSKILSVKKVLLLLFAIVISTFTFAQQKETQSNVIDNFKVYPNPTRNSINVNIGKLKGGISFQINDALGTLVYSRKIVSYDLQKDSFKLNMSSFRNGIYMFSMKTKTASKTIKVVKL